MTAPPLPAPTPQSPFRAAQLWRSSNQVSLSVIRPGKLTGHLSHRRGGGLPTGFNSHFFEIRKREIPPVCSNRGWEGSIERPPRSSSAENGQLFPAVRSSTPALEG